MGSVRYTHPAQKDIRQIHYYIGLDNLPAATRVVRRIRDTCESLLKFPDMGRARDDLPTSRRLRSIGCSPYSIFYEAVGQDIEIARVIHMSMDIRATDFS